MKPPTPDLKGLPEETRKTLTKAMMLNFARGCLETMKIIECDRDISNWLLPFYLLAATNLELCAKIVLFKQMENNNRTLNETEKDLRKYDHNLSYIYSSTELFNFCNQIGISKVSLIKDDGVFRYDFYLNGEVNPIYVYDAESMKYGLMTGKENVGFVACQTSNLLKLCENTFQIMINI